MTTGHKSATAFEEGVSAVTATPSVQLGERREYNGDQYVYAYNNSDSQLVPGYHAVHATAATGYSFTITHTAGMVPVGMCKNSTFTTQTYGWLMTSGYHASAAGGTPGTIAAADKVFPSTSGTWNNLPTLTVTLCAGTPASYAETATGTAGAFAIWFQGAWK
jgi:hypothetical protein